MVDYHNDRNLTLKLLELMQTTGCPLVQHNGQRRFGPPPDWVGPIPPKGCEVFIGKLPRDIFEDELVPLFASVGTIYEMRLMMDFSGSNRGYAFVTYATRAQAATAIKQLNGHEIRPRRNIGVVKSVDNCKLFIGNLPKIKTREEVLEELSKLVSGIVDVVLYKNSFNRNLNRGFAFVEFTSHTAAAMARRELVPGCVKLWDQELMVDWAEPEPAFDDEKMSTVKVLYVRNFSICTTQDQIKKIFEETINNKIEWIKKIYDYAFIHFYERQHAELAMSKLQNASIDGSNIEISWSRPVDRDLYRIQKLHRGNAKFNNNFDFAQTLMLYKQHLDRKEYANCSPNDEGIGSANAEDSPSISPMDFQTAYQRAHQSGPADGSIYILTPARLESMCKRYQWGQPIYRYSKYTDQNRAEVWVCTLTLPKIGHPLLAVPRSMGPFNSRPWYSMQQAYVEAAEIALQALKMLKVEVVQQTVSPAPAAYPAVPNCVRYPYDYAALYTAPVLPLTLPGSAIWRTI